jgi:hypothetical protein
MANLNERIAKLEAEIDGYASKLNDASNENLVAIYAGLINSRTTTLNKLLDQKNSLLRVAEESKGMMMQYLILMMMFFYNRLFLIFTSLILLDCIRCC